MSQTDPNHNVPCDEACSAYLELLPPDREFIVMEDAVAEGVFAVVLVEVSDGPLNSGTVVFVTNDEEMAEMCAKALTEHEDPIVWLAAMASMTLEAVWCLAEEEE